MTFLKSHVYYPHMEQTNTTPEGLIESAHGIEAVLANLYKNFPHLPKTARKVLADIAPWLALISGLFGLLSLMTYGAIMSSMFALGGVIMILGITALVLGIIGSVLQLLAFNPLRARERKGWNFLFYSALIGALSVILSFSTSMMTLSTYGRASGLSAFLSTTIGYLIAGWLLFEIRKQFRNK